MAPEKSQQPASHFSNMLLRQFPWIRKHLQPGEFPLALSYQKAEILPGVSLLLIGAVVLLDSLLHPAAFGHPLLVVPVVLAGAVLLYSGIWLLLFAKRTYVLVTSHRLIYQKMDLLGKPGRSITILRSDIKRASFLKSTVMYLIRRGDGAVSLTLQSGKTYLLPNLVEGERICSALGVSRSSLSTPT